ncbi:hypothetical protein LTR53_018702, partial [Teratosphaeriaceae sp. CCFEE 6253]
RGRDHARRLAGRRPRARAEVRGRGSVGRGRAVYPGRAARGETSAAVEAAERAAAASRWDGGGGPAVYGARGRGGEAESEAQPADHAAGVEAHQPVRLHVPQSEGDRPEHEPVPGDAAGLHEQHACQEPARRPSSASASADRGQGAGRCGDLLQVPRRARRRRAARGAAAQRVRAARRPDPQDRRRRRH